MQILHHKEQVECVKNSCSQTENNARNKYHYQHTVSCKETQTSSKLPKVVPFHSLCHASGRFGSADGEDKAERDNERERVYQYGPLRIRGKVEWSCQCWAKNERNVESNIHRGTRLRELLRRYNISHQGRPRWIKEPRTYARKHNHCVDARKLLRKRYMSIAE